MNKISLISSFVVLIMIVTEPTWGQNNQIILELKKPIMMGASIPVKFKRYKKGKLKKIKEKYLNVKVSTGTYANRKINIPHNADHVKDHQINVLFNWKRQPNVWYDTTFFVDYSGDIFANFAGHNGRDGDDKGRKLGIFLIGRDGSTGNDGDHGGQGKDGEDIDVFLDVYYDTLLKVDLLKAKIISKTSSMKGTYLVNTKTGKLSISANGGRGGDGGDGGGGGDGKDAKAPTEKKSAKAPGCGGNGGDGGNGGHGGNGGRITVFVKPLAKAYMHLINLANYSGKKGRRGSCGSGGDGGSGGYDYQDGKSGEIGVSGRSGEGGVKGSKPEIIFLEEVDK